LALVSFSTVFFPRVLAGLGVPAVINFLHFVTIPLSCGVILSKAQLRSRIQFSAIQSVIWGLVALLAVMCCSALLNEAGLLNVFLQFLLLGEPFLFLIAIISLSFSEFKLEQFNRQWLRFSLVNLLFALFQILVFRLDGQNADLVKGVFVGQGSGHVVSAAISLSFGIFYFATAKDRHLFVRLGILLCCLFHVVRSDAKQVLAVYIVALLILVLLKAQNLRRFVMYILIAAGFVGLVMGLAMTVMPALLIWADLDTQKEGLTLKMISFSIIPTFYHSPLNWLFGLGPGHTVGRLGGWMIWEYEDLLRPLGVTTSEASVAVWRQVGASWLGDRSSWFSPLFGWAGIWGDSGFLGLGVYLFLWQQVWTKLCQTDLSRFFALTVLVYGTIMSQIEEPGYMIYMIGIIALCWHQARLQADVNKLKLEQSISPTQNP
jgi:hypothetical protein